MWTEILAGYAAVVSTGSLGVTYLSYRSGGPQLSGFAEIHGRYDIEGPTLHISVYNRGRGASTVDFMLLWGIGIALGKPSPVIGWPLHTPKGELPVRIEGHSGASWHFPAIDITKDWLSRNDLIRLEVTINLANGKHLPLKVQTSNIDVLDITNLPDWEPDYFKDRSELPSKDSRPEESGDQPPPAPSGE